MKICQTVFPQTSGYLKYRPKEGEGGGGALIGRMALNRGGALVDLLFWFRCSWSSKKNIDKVAKESGFLRIPRGGTWGWALIRRRALLRAWVLIQRNTIFLTGERLGRITEWLKNEKGVKQRRRASEKQNMLSREDESMNMECLI